MSEGHGLNDIGRGIKMSERGINLPVRLIKSDNNEPETTFNAGEGEHIRRIGCNGHRQCVVEHTFGQLMIYEERVENGHVISIPVDELFRKSFVAIIKANDGTPVKDALNNGMDRLTTYEEVHG